MLKKPWQLTSNKREYNLSASMKFGFSLVLTLIFYADKITHRTGGEPVSCTGIPGTGSLSVCRHRYTWKAIHSVPYILQKVSVSSEVWIGKVVNLAMH